MKKLALVLFFISVALIGCKKSNQDVAVSLTKEYLKTSLNDPKSYEPISFSELDSVFTRFSNDKTYILLEDSLKRRNMKFEHNLEMAQIETEYNRYGEARKFIEEAEIHKNKASEFSKQLEQFLNNFVPQFDGYKIEHEFRATNAMNALVKSTYVFYFDKDVTKVIDAEQID